jgi:hypothetical protein
LGDVISGQPEFPEGTANVAEFLLIFIGENGGSMAIIMNFVEVDNIGWNVV